MANWWLISLSVLNVARALVPSKTGGRQDVGSQAFLRKREMLMPFEDRNNSETDVVVGPRASTFAVVSRIIESELPYVESFLKHYASLGVDTFYFLLNHPSERPQILSFLKKHPVSQASIVLHTVDGDGGNPNDILRNETALIHDVKEDYVIGIDMDEYWELPEDSESLTALVHLHPADCYIMDWVLIVDDRMLANSGTEENQQERQPFGIQAHAGKWMCKSSMIDHVAIHYPSLKKEFENSVVTRDHDVGSMIHFWGRGFRDQLIKNIAQTFIKGATGVEGMSQLMHSGKLPGRLMMLAFLSLLPHPMQVRTKRHLLQVDHDLERHIEAKLLNKSVYDVDKDNERAHQAYQDFKNKLKPWIEAGQYPTYPQHTLVEIGKWLEAVQKDFEHLAQETANADASVTSKGEGS